MIIDVYVNIFGKIITDPDIKIISNTKNIFKIRFIFQKDWEDIDLYQVSFQLNNDDYIRKDVENNVVVIPEEVLEREGILRFALIGTRNVEGEVIDIMSTTYSKIRVVEGGFQPWE